ncbi:hypothetical protein BKA82DRAFT_36073 [Pisolithus tinctorius]|uniref:Uncharacterized protein n=1 Tax=Pisolithus tinctorius Marx 270 TaxID=870435 RepID=A0A0C3NCC0_PISTI|nr:hypothetical protein BKA82DRAFT_36073 [Pisolithus tinctorius]KIN93470.1 hypothetical protein M404DRAFT_36073 [Pisolithus tinctorius Marx 270]
MHRTHVFLMGNKKSASAHRLQKTGSQSSLPINQVPDTSSICSQDMAPHSETPDLDKDGLGITPGDTDGTSAHSPVDTLKRKSIRLSVKPVSCKENSPELDKNVILLVPQAANEGSKHLVFSQWTPFSEVLDEIYSTIGCQNFACKPMLSYKLSTSAQKDDAINLGTLADWDGCLEQVNSAWKKKKDSVVSVKILVSEQYMSTLRAMHGKKKPPGKGKNPPLLDLDNDGSSADDEDSAAIEKENKSLMELEKSLKLCQRCGPSKYCKINRAGQHVNLTFNQHRGWALTLGHEMHGVTLKTPPKGDLFSEFHAPQSDKTSSTSATQMPLNSPYMSMYGWPPMPPMPPMMPPWMVPPVYQAPATPVTPTMGEKRGELSPSELDHDTRPTYPTIVDFLTKLDASFPKHKLSVYIPQSEAMDFYNIDELRSLSEEQLMKDFGMSLGNSCFLLSEVAQAVRQVERKKRTRVE